jgi:hypothetical protein
MGHDVPQPLELELKLEVRLEKQLKVPVDLRILDRSAFLDSRWSNIAPCQR